MAPFEQKLDKAFSLLSLSKIQANIENYSYVPIPLVMQKESTGESTGDEVP